MFTSLEDTTVLMKVIVKTFSRGVIANDHTTFDLKRGETHGLLRENNVGETTLVNTFYGLYKPNLGEIHTKGRRVNSTHLGSSSILWLHSYFNLHYLLHNVSLYMFILANCLLLRSILEKKIY